MTPIHVLFAAADPFSYDPTDTYVTDPRLGLDEDLRAILQKVRAAEHRDALAFHPSLAARPDDLLQAMNEVHPDVVHFSGHAGAEGVVLVGSDGQPKHVSGETLARLFRAAGERVRLVVLSACHSEAIAEAVARQVGVAVGIAGAWPDASAVAFNASFYRALAFGRPVRQAFEQGITAIELEGLDGADLPRLFVRPGVDAARVAFVAKPRDSSDRRMGPGRRRMGGDDGGVQQVVKVRGTGNDVLVSAGDTFIPGVPTEKLPRVDFETTVWFATNRRPRIARNSLRGFGSARDDRTHYGRCKVFIPESHRIGELGSPLWRRLLRSDDRLKLRKTEVQEESLTWKQIRAALSGVPAPSRHAVAFIHGYNVTFEGAALRAAQIGFDLQIPAMAFFSWPSHGRSRFYAPDEATIGASELAIEEFLTKFATLHDSGTAIHVIAHSMGNRALLRAMERIVSRAEAHSGRWFDQIILAAPDVDRDEFRQLAGVYSQACVRTTLYVSDRDRALAGSKWIHQENRVGYSPPVTIIPGIDTVNVTNIDLSLLGHGYVAEAKEVLYDMHDLIFNGTEPDRRMALRARRIPEGQYWEVRA